MRERSRETAKKIINSGIVLFNQSGYVGTSINDIAKNCGLSKGILYYYFENKDDLYLTCVRKCAEDFNVYCDRDIGSITHNISGILAFLRNRLRFFEEYPMYCMLFHSILTYRPEHLKTQLKEIQDSFQENNMSRFIYILDGMTLRNGMTKEDCISFMQLLQHNSMFGMASVLDKEVAMQQEETMVRLATIFFACDGSL